VKNKNDKKKGEKGSRGVNEGSQFFIPARGDTSVSNRQVKNLIKIRTESKGNDKKTANRREKSGTWSTKGL